MPLDLLILEPYDKEQSAFEAMRAPQKAARGREDDRFFILLSQHGTMQLEPAALKGWLQRLALHFFDQGGSVTRALQAVADRANDDALVQNVNHPDPMHPYACDILAGAVHHDLLLVLQAGNLALGTLPQDAWQKHNDPSLALRPMGLAAAPKTVLFQVPLRDGELLALGKRLPEGGSPAEQTPLFDWLDSANEAEPRVLIQARHGEGSVRSLPRAKVLGLWLQDQQMRGAKEALEAAHAEEQLFNEPDTSGTLLEAPAETSYPLGAEELPENVEPIVPKPDSEPPEHVYADGEVDTPEPYELATEHTAPFLPDQAPSFEADLALGQETLPPMPEIPAPEDDLLLQLRQEREAQRLAARAAEQVQRQRAQKENLEKAKQTALRTVADGAGFLNRLENKTQSHLNKTDPKTGEPVYRPVSSLTKILLAILVPLVVVIMAGAVYLARGRNTQFNEYLAMARDSASRAVTMDSDGERQAAWTQVLAYLNRAEALERNNETAALRQEAQLALDGLDRATPVQFARINLPVGTATAQLTQLVAYNLDLFALDENSGTVLHFTQKDGGFTYDTSFTCGPGSYDGINVAKLKLITAIPYTNNFRAPLAGMDGAGNLVYCAVGQSPRAAQLAMPEGGWAQPKAAVYDSGRLMILDTEREALWLYRGAADALTNAPTNYFDPQQLDLTGAIDFAVSGDETFVLYADGHSAHCISSAISGTMECTNPAPYLDERADATPQDFSLVVPQRLAFAPPPEAAVYYLDPRMGRLYQFSLRLNLNSVLRPAPSSLGLPIQPVTAFLVTPNRLVFYAYGNQLFYGYLP